MQVLAQDLAETSLTLDPKQLPGGQAQFRVVVSDGLNETQLVSPPVQVNDRQPQVIASLPWGETFTEGEAVIAEAAAYDLEDGELDPLGIQWADGTGRVLGQGATLRLENLLPGAYTLIAWAYDTAGQSASASLQVVVEQAPWSGPDSETWLTLAWGVAVLLLIAAPVLVLFLFLATRRRPAAQARRPAGLPSCLGTLMVAGLLGLQAIILAAVVSFGYLEGVALPDMPSLEGTWGLGLVTGTLVSLVLGGLLLFGGLMVSLGGRSREGAGCGSLALGAILAGMGLLLLAPALIMAALLLFQYGRPWLGV